MEINEETERERERERQRTMAMRMKINQEIRANELMAPG